MKNLKKGDLVEIQEFVSKDDIIAFFKNNGLLNKYFTFACYCDSVFTFEGKVPKSTTFFEISIISEGEYLAKEKLFDLLTRKDIKYLSVTYFVPENGHDVAVENMTYRKNKK